MRLSDLSSLCVKLILTLCAADAHLALSSGNAQTGLAGGAFDVFVASAVLQAFYKLACGGAQIMYRIEVFLVLLRALYSVFRKNPQHD